MSLKRRAVGVVSAECRLDPLVVPAARQQLKHRGESLRGEAEQHVDTWHTDGTCLCQTSPSSELVSPYGMQACPAPRRPWRLGMSYATYPYSAVRAQNGAYPGSTGNYRRLQTT